MALKIQILVAAMNQKDYTLLEKMQICSDVIVGNQSDKNLIEEFKYNGKNVQYLSFAEKGVGLNRNNTLIRADADISIIADDDMVFLDNYESKVMKVYEQNPTADVIIFNLADSDAYYTVTKKKTIRYFNMYRIGAPRITFKTKKVQQLGISFSLHFGGGTSHSAGEDTLFLVLCKKAGLKIIAVPESIAYLKEERESTWFRGYTDKYFVDKGLLFSLISKRFSNFLCLQDAVRHRRLYAENGSWLKNYQLMLKGRE